MTVNDKPMSIASVATAFEGVRKAYVRGRMGKREMEIILMNLRRFLEDCGVVEPMFTIHPCKEEADNGDE